MSQRDQLHGPLHLPIQPRLSRRQPRSVKERDKHLFERVTFYTDLIAEELGFEESRRRWLKRASLLHDIGKLGVSNSILDKPGKLTESEWSEIKKHPAYMEDILSRIGAFSELASVAGAYHEKLDGTGYPKGLSGQEIQLETRVMTTADIFGALTAERPYRGPMPHEKALNIMEQELNTAIDPECFTALKAILPEIRH